jgi:hypothetical protein
MQDPDTFAPKLPQDYTVGEKIAYFDLLHDQALNAFIDMTTDQYDDNTEHLIYEKVMEMLGSGIWPAVNRLLK